MSKLDWVKLYGTTDSGGALTVTAGISTRGELRAVEWIDGTFDDGVDAVISVVRDDDSTNLTLITLTNANDDAMYYPRHIIHSEAGAALTGTSGGDRVEPIINGYLKMVVASGGNAKTGGCIVYYEC